MKNSIKYNIGLVLKFCRIINKISRSYIPLTLINIFLASGISLVNVIFPKFIIDELLGGRSVARIALFVGLTIGVNFASNMIIHIIGYYFDKQNIKVAARLDVILGEKSLELDYEQVEQKENLELKERAMFVIRNQNALDRMIGSIKNVVQNIITIIGLLAIILTFDVLVIIFIALVLLLSSFIFKKQNQTSFRVNQELIPINRIFTYYSGVTTDFSAGKDIRIYNMQPLVLGKIDDFIEKNLSGLSKLSKNEAKYQALGSINLNVENICIYAYMCYKVLVGAIGIGDFSMYISAVNNFGNAISGLIFQFFEFSNMCQYLSPFFEFLEIKPNSEDGFRDLTDIENFELEFDNVSFCYPGTDKMVLKDICVKIKPREKVSIVGANGAGKTTFIKLLTRLYRPVSGQILLNGININEYKHTEYIKFFSAVFQDYKNYAFTIKENIALAESGKTSSDSIISILKNLSMEDKILNLKNGIDTALYKIFDKDGVEFSGGEMQKIAIARANFKNADVVFLDEPTSALDPVMEYEIMKNFNHMVEGKTAIYISHRLSSCKFSDRILIFHEGKIVQEGVHNELMQKEEGLYYEMFSSQAEHYVS